MSASGDWGPAPPGVDLSENQTGEILRSVIAFMVIGILAVSGRMFARYKTKAKLARDDYLLLAALAFAIGTAVPCIISIPYGGGKHLWVLTFDDFTTLWKMTYAFVLIYATCVSLTKASILLFYRRVFGTSRPFYVCLFLVIGYWVAIITAWFSGCRPASYFWEQFTNPEAKGYCMNTSLFYFVNGICAMLIDVAILMVPLPTNAVGPKAGGLLHPSAWRLVSFFPASTSRDTGSDMTSSVCVASIIRIVSMDKLVKASDFTWYMAQVFIWSCCEPFVGIICACLPTYGPFLRRWWKATVSLNGYPSGEGSGFNPDSTNVQRNKARMEWKQLSERSVELRQDDEVELTNEIYGGQNNASLRTKTSDEECTTGGGIRVQRDFSWARDTAAEQKRY
ncbi:integral membrane pth11 [Fusarium albosuccineum]|uniref:Integral membrane pth11 n=1 Tax=Fusarium albosuccineum TaxID=1237068 RepID=A0A8H4L7I8_9HYPO|nr:integral membrane pth11 [Fusarium albosuccineum]